MNPLAFISPTPRAAVRRGGACAVVAPRRPGAAALQRRVATAVLDTPASNTYLQQHAEVALRDFLTRRAVDTVLYYMHELHDGTGWRWLREFEEFDTKGKRDAFKDGDLFLAKMLGARDETGIVKVGPKRFARSYTYEIRPRRIARRILDSRLQLAQEWIRDLGWIQLDNVELQRVEFERLLSEDEKVVDSKRNLAFENDPQGGCTPLRWQNYQKLKTLVTRHAVARLLPYTRDCGSNHEYMYLLSFARGYGEIRNGDDFVTTLMAKPIEARTNPDHTIMPRSIALQLLELRKAIADEWIAVMKVVPDEQQLMDRDLLEKSLHASNVLGEDWRRPGSKAEDGVDAEA